MIDLTGSVFALLLLSFVSIILNSFCIHVIRTKHAFREKPSTVFLANLLIVHLVQGVVVLPMYVGKSFKVKDLFWQRFFKNGFLFSYLLAFYGVCLGVLNISLDRFLATYLLTKYRQFVSFKNAVCVLIVTWIYICILSIIPFIPKPSEGKSSKDDSKDSGRNVSMMNNLLPINETGSGNLTTNESLSITKGAKPRTYFYTPQDEWTVFMLFFNAALPFLIIVVCYVYIIYRIRKVEATQLKYEKENKGGESTLSPGAERKVKGFKKYKEITYLTLVLSTIYFFLWTPSITYYTILSVCKVDCFPADWNDSKPEKHIVYIIKFLSYLNALFSPVIYCLWHPEMRKSFMRIKRTISRQPNPQEMGTDNLASSTSGF